MHRRVVAGLAATAILATALPATAVASGATIAMPPLSGRHAVGTTDLHLVDHARADPWDPSRRREVMTTISYPADRAGSGRRTSWMAPGVAAAVDAASASPYLLDLPRGSVDWASVRRQARSDVAVDRSRGDWPVVLFSPGFSGPRELNAGLTDDLTSRGYVVVSMSHTYESLAVEFPGGRVQHAIVDEGDLTSRQTAIDARIADTQFVLDQLTLLDRGENPDAEHDALPRGLAGSLDLSRIGMFGHSYGGYTAGETMVQDRRIDAGINVDGAMAHGLGDNPYLPGEIVRQGVDRPFLLVGGDDVDPDTGRKTEHSHADRTLDATWADFWPNQRGWKRDLHLDGSTHYSFTDLQIVVPQLDSLLSPAKQTQIVGSIDPARSLTAQHDYLAAYFDLHLKGHDRHLFDGSSPCYPDVRFIE